MECYNICAAILLCISYSLFPVESDPDLILSVPDGSSVYIDQQLTITCIARGTQVIAWQSDSYLGLGGQLAFGPSDQPGETAKSQVMDETFALLIVKDTEDGELRLESQLHLTVSPRYQTFTIICRNVDQDRSDNVTYHKSGDNATQLNVGSNETLCLDDNPRLECMARNTSIIELSSSAYSDTVQCRKDDPPIRNLTLAGTIGHDDFGFVVKRSYSALTSVLTCSLSIEGTRFPVAINQHQLSITCLNVDIGVSRTASFIMTDNCNTGYDNTTQLVEYVTVPRASANDAFGNRSAVMLLLAVTQGLCVRM